MTSDSPSTDQQHETHIHLDDRLWSMLHDIASAVWKEQSRSGKPTRIEGIRHSIAHTHKSMFK